VHYVTLIRFRDGLSYSTPPQKSKKKKKKKKMKKKKQGEMPLPSLGPIHFKYVEFRDGIGTVIYMHRCLGQLKGAGTRLLNHHISRKEARWW